MTKPTKRTSLRLPAALMADLAADSDQRGAKTRIVNKALNLLVHDLQFERIEPSVIETLSRQTEYNQERSVLYIRVPLICLHYLQLNGLNLTTCVCYALKTYLGYGNG